VHVIGFELRMSGRMAAVLPDVTSAVLIVVGLRLTAGRALRWIVPLAVARAFLLPGGFLFQLWLLLVGFLLVRAVRRVINHELWQMQVVLGIAVAAVLSLLFGAALGDGADPLGRGPIAFLVTGAIIPGVLVCHSILTGKTSRQRADLGVEGA